MEKENRINLEEFYLKQLDVIFQMKDRLESKASGYLTTVALILSVQAAFISIVFNVPALQTKVNCFLLLEFVVFGIGIIVLLFCSWMLLPRDIWHFDSVDLEKIDIMETLEKKEEYIISENKHFIIETEKAVESLRFGYKVSSVGVIALIFSFIVVTIVFFIFTVGCR